jgi:flagellar FliL protein
MSDIEQIVDASSGTAARKRGRGLRLGLGLAMALLLAGGGFFGARSGAVDPIALIRKEADSTAVLDDVAFVQLDPITLSLPPGSSSKLLRFSGHLEVVPEQREAVTGLMPRIQDVLNTYLRAVDVEDLEEPAALLRLRAQMLRRVQVVVGDGPVRDLLVTEFVLN